MLTDTIVPYPAAAAKAKPDEIFNFLLTAAAGDGIILSVSRAAVAQQVEQLTRNEQVVRSNRISSSKDPVLVRGRDFLFSVSLKRTAEDVGPYIAIHKVVVCP